MLSKSIKSQFVRKPFHQIASFAVCREPGHNSKNLLHAPHKIRTSWLKSVVREIIPLTSQTISARGQSVDNLEIAASYCNAQSALKENETDVFGKKRTDDSWLELYIPFSEHKSLRENMSKADGVNMRYGKLFEILDALASDVAYRHIGTELASKIAIVTAGVDSLKANAEISLQDDLKLQGYLTYVGRSSMEVTIDMISVNASGDEISVGNTQFIMVARGDKGAHPVPGLLITNEEAKKAFTIGQQNVEIRKQKAATDLSIQPPHSDEMNVVHALYLLSKRIANVNEYSSEKQRVSTTFNNAPPMMLPSIPQIDINEMNTIESLIKQGKYNWMKNTVFKNTQFMHLQNRNIHGKIFGGFIMRIAFELAAVCAACFVGDENAMFAYVDEIQFVKSINIGSIVEFSSMITYNRGNEFVVQVVAEDVSPVNSNRTRTNVLTYVFRTTDEVAKTIPVVLPSTYGEILHYLEGKRALDLLHNGEKECAKLHGKTVSDDVNKQ